MACPNFLHFTSLETLWLSKSLMLILVVCRVWSFWKVHLVLPIWLLKVWNFEIPELWDRTEPNKRCWQLLVLPSYSASEWQKCLPVSLNEAISIHEHVIIFCHTFYKFSQNKEYTRELQKGICSGASVTSILIMGLFLVWNADKFWSKS